MDASLQVLAKNTHSHTHVSTPFSVPPSNTSLRAAVSSSSGSTGSSLGQPDPDPGPPHQRTHHLNHHHQSPLADPSALPSGLSSGSDTAPSEATTRAATAASSSSASPTEHFEHFEQLEQMQKRNRLISAVVSKMFAGENEDSLVVDDMPIHNIRKLVARQMSMSLQLMIQMLLLSENMSESDRQCSSHLMELSNLRSCECILFIPVSTVFTACMHLISWVFTL